MQRNMFLTLQEDTEGIFAIHEDRIQESKMV